MPVEDIEMEEASTEQKIEDKCSKQEVKESTDQKNEEETTKPSDAKEKKDIGVNTEDITTE